MAQIGFSQARTGRRGTGNRGNIVENFQYEQGKNYRIFIPTIEDENGEPNVVLFAETIHPLGRKGIINIPSKKGSYSTYAHRCSHPYSQQTPQDAIKIAQSGEYCPLCELEMLENRERSQLMQEEYGEEGFGKLSKKDQKAFYNNNQLTLEKSYYKKEIDGEDVTVQSREMYMLVVEIETELVDSGKEVKNKKTGKTRKKKVTKPVMEDGEVKYTPKLMKVSSNRLLKIKNAVDEALENDVISEDSIFRLVENEGTEFEEDNIITWLDLKLKFPNEGNKMQSGKNMSVSAMKEDNSLLQNYPDIVKNVSENMEKYYEESQKLFNLMFKHLQLYKKEDLIEMFDEETYDRYHQLKETLKTKEDEEFEQKVFKNVLETFEDFEGESADVDEGTEENLDDDLEESDDSSEEESKEDKKKSKKTTKAKKGTKGKSKTKKKSTEDESDSGEEDSDDDSDEDDGYSDEGDSDEGDSDDDDKDVDDDFDEEDLFDF